jgi:deuterolysin
MKISKHRNAITGHHTLKLAMRFATLSTALLGFAQYVHSLPVEADGASVLDVALTQVSDTRIKAVVKNSGKEDVTFVHLNFFRDSAPVKKVDVFQNGMLRL